jgi:hypothetical protein
MNLNTEQTRTKNLRQYIDNVRAFMRREQKDFTDQFYKDKDILKMTWAQRRQLHKDFHTQWEAREKDLYKLLAS